MSSSLPLLYILSGRRIFESKCSLIHLADPSSAPIILARLQNPLKTGFEKVNDDLKKVHKGQSSYGKALDKVRASRISCVSPC